jgi:hypothetical protein
MLQTIQAQVSPDTLDKVSRLFNSSITDCLNELLQNARRAGATKVKIDLSERQLTIADDGIGIANLQTLLTLGASGWSPQTQQQEDPAGMGIFSLANRNVMIRSQNWEVHLSPEHFAGRAIASAVSQEIICGTQIQFTVTEDEAHSLEYQLRKVTMFYPLPVEWNGNDIFRQDFLDEAIYVEVWQGLRIGVSQRYRYNNDAINFYGLTLQTKLPSLECNNTTFAVRVDVVDCPHLKLVLPARKEIVQDAFWLRLKTEIQRVLYCYIATLPHHNLSFLQWQRANSLGVELPVAKAELHQFIPAIANGCNQEQGEVVAVSNRSVLIDVEGLSYGTQQVFWRTFQQMQLNHELVAENVSYVGYTWYDELPRLSNVRFVIEQAGQSLSIEQWQALAHGYEQGCERVEQIWMLADRTGGSQSKMRSVCDVLLVDDPEDHWGEMEDLLIVLNQSASIEVEELAELLEAACFCLSEDSDADSSYTQQEDFRERAYERSAYILLTEQDALRTRIEMIANRHLKWVVPSNQRLEIRLLSRTESEAWVTVNL